MPAGRAFAPGGVPFHLPLPARRAGAPNGKVTRMALAFHRINACIARIVSGPSQCAIIRNGGAIEIEAAVELIAMIGCNAFGIIDHLADMVRGDRPFCRFDDVEVSDILLEGLGIMRCDVPDTIGLCAAAASILSSPASASDVRWPTSVMLMIWVTS